MCLFCHSYIRYNEILSPDEDVLKNAETFKYLDEEMNQDYYELWKKVKSKNYIGEVFFPDSIEIIDIQKMS